MDGTGLPIAFKKSPKHLLEYELASVIQIFSEQLAGLLTNILSGNYYVIKDKI